MKLFLSASSSQQQLLLKLLFASYTNKLLLKRHPTRVVGKLQRQDALGILHEFFISCNNDNILLRM